MIRFSRMTAPALLATLGVLAAGASLAQAKPSFESLDKKPADLREHRLITHQSDKIRFVELKNAHGTTQLQKSGSEWRIQNAPTLSSSPVL